VVRIWNKYNRRKEEGEKMSLKNYVYNRVENIANLKSTLEVKVWDLEDLEKEIETIKNRIKFLEEKEKVKE